MVKLRILGGGYSSNNKKQLNGKKYGNSKIGIHTNWNVNMIHNSEKKKVQLIAGTYY